MREITSVNNSIIKSVRQLKKHKYRKAEQSYIIEGFHLVEEAIKSRAPLEKIFFTQQGWHTFSLNRLDCTGVALFLISDTVMKNISENPTSQGILAIVKIQQAPDFLPLDKPILLLDGVQDPGNVGTMIRTADAAGFGSVVLGEGCADLFSGKVLRAMQGSHFHLEILHQKLMPILLQLSNEGIPTYGTLVSDSAKSYHELKKETVFALIMGNEGKGMSLELKDHTTDNLYIPMFGQAESLNVAVAAGILMFALKK